MFSLLLALILTQDPTVAPIEHETRDTWTTVGETVSFCSYWGLLYHLQESIEERGASLQIVGADGKVTNITGDLAGQWTCEVEFSKQPIVTGELEYWVSLHFNFLTEESLEFLTLAMDLSMTFCEVVPDTPIWGVVTMTMPNGATKRRECEQQEF